MHTIGILSAQKLHAYPLAAAFAHTYVAEHLKFIADLSLHQSCLLGYGHVKHRHGAEGISQRVSTSFVLGEHYNRWSNKGLSKQK
jgi:hypothetical protein